MYYEYYQDTDGQWRWVAHAAKYEPIAMSSEAYVNQRDCLRAIELMKGSGSAPILKALTRSSLWMTGIGVPSDSSHLTESSVFVLTAL